MAALRAGYSHDRGSPAQEFRAALLISSRRWCTAGGHAQIVMSPDSVGLRRIKFDVVGTGRDNSATDEPHYEGVVDEVNTVYRSDC